MLILIYMKPEGYVFIAGILLYLTVVRMLGSKYLSPLKAAGIVVGGYFVLSTALQAALLLAFGEPLSQLYSMEVLATIALQYILAAGVFYMIIANEDSYMAYLGFGAAGLVLIFFVAPAAMRSIF